MFLANFAQKEGCYGGKQPKILGQQADSRDDQAAGRGGRKNYSLKSSKNWNLDEMLLALKFSRPFKRAEELVMKGPSPRPAATVLTRRRPAEITSPAPGSALKA